MKKEDLNFTIYCVGIVAESLGRDARDVYRLMQQVTPRTHYNILLHGTIHRV